MHMNCRKSPLRKTAQAGDSRAGTAKLLLLDEPAAGMNPEETASYEVYLRIRDEFDLTIFLIETDMNCDGICERIRVIDYGYPSLKAHRAQSRETLG